MRIQHLVFALTLPLVGLVSSCTKSSNAPSSENIRGFIAGGLPPHVKLIEIETEPIGGGAFNFKAKLELREALYLPGEQPDGFRQQVIKSVQREGEKIAAYGRFRTERVMDTWRLSDLEFSSGLEQLGAPRGKFAADALIEGSPELATAVRAFQAKVAEDRRIAAEEAERKRKEAEATAARQKREQEELIATQKREQEEFETRKREALKVEESRIIAAFSAGKTYEGVLSPKGTAVRLTALEQRGFLVTVLLANSESAEQTTMKGQIELTAEGTYSVTVTEVSASIVLATIHRTSLTFRLESDGSVVGEGDGFRLRMQPATPSRSQPTGAIPGEAQSNAPEPHVAPVEAISTVDAAIAAASSSGAVLHGAGGKGEPFTLRAIRITDQNGGFSAEYHQAQGDVALAIEGRATRSTLRFKSVRFIKEGSSIGGGDDMVVELTLQPGTLVAKGTAKVSFFPKEKVTLDLSGKEDGK